MTILGITDVDSATADPLPWLIARAIFEPRHETTDKTYEIHLLLHTFLSWRLNLCLTMHYFLPLPFILA